MDVSVVARVGLEKVEQGIRRAALPLDVEMEALTAVREPTDSTLVAFLDMYSAPPPMDYAAVDYAAVVADRVVEVLGPVFKRHGVNGRDVRNAWCDIYLALDGQKPVTYEQKS